MLCATRRYRANPPKKTPYTGSADWPKHRSLYRDLAINPTARRGLQQLSRLLCFRFYSPGFTDLWRTERRPIRLSGLSNVNPFKFLDTTAHVLWINNTTNGALLHAIEVAVHNNGADSSRCVGVACCGHPEPRVDGGSK